MTPLNQSRNQTAFTISIEAKKGVTTGISAKDRARTIKVATKKKVLKKEIVSPGHIFPIVAKDGGVLVRAGHTEASVDISRFAKKNSSAVICEIMDDDGKMAKGEKLINFAKKHKLKIGRIDDLIIVQGRNIYAHQVEALVSTIEGVREDVTDIIMNLKNVTFNSKSNHSQKLSLNVKGPKEVLSSDFDENPEVEIIDKEADFFCRHFD